MKVVLVKPYNRSDHIQPSLGLGYLAAAIRGKHDVRIMDCLEKEIGIQKFGGAIKALKPDIVGFQCYTFDLRFVAAALRIAKRIDKNIITLVGGPHPSAAGIEMMRDLEKTLDFAFASEAEVGLARFLDALADLRTDFHGIPGLIWRDGADIRSNATLVVDDLDSLGMPAWDLIHPERYPESQHGAFFKKFPIAPIMATRGCPYQCTFCAGHTVGGRKLRRRSVGHVLKEIALLYRDFGIREFHIVDDNFTADKTYVKELLKQLRSMNLDISWAVPNGVRMDSLDEEVLALMKETGLYLISLGIESGSDRILKMMRKNISVAQIRECVRMIDDAGIAMAGFFILGFPGDDESSIRDTMRLSLELPLKRANFFTYLPFPGSESYDELKDRGELEAVDWKRFYFMNAAYVPKGLTRKRLKALQRAAFARFYLRPRILLYHICAIKSFRHLFFLLRRFYNWMVMG